MFLTNKNIILLSLLLILVILEASGCTSYVNMEVYRIVFSKVNEDVMVLISFSASLEATVIYIVFLVLKDFYCKRNLSENTLGLISALALSMTTVFILKIALHTPRPPESINQTLNLASLVDGVNAYAYPSGHVARAATIAGYLSKYVKNKALLALLWIWALWVLISRLILGLHWFTDVIASLIIGLLSANISYEIRDYLHNTYYEFKRKLLR